MAAFTQESPFEGNHTEPSVIQVPPEPEPCEIEPNEADRLDHLFLTASARRGLPDTPRSGNEGPLQMHDALRSNRGVEFHMSKIWTFCLLSTGILLSSLPALAEGSENQWAEQQFGKRMETSENAAIRRAARAEARPQKRVSVSSDDNDDGTRPQRKAAVKARPSRESLSGGSGETGVASYYWEPQALASGGRFNPNAMTAAHKTLPFGTRVRVTHLGTGNSVDVVINDRGPYIAGRIIDLSKRAAQNIGMTGSGVAKVRVAILGR